MSPEIDEQQLRKLKAAYASGVLRVRYGDVDLTYQSMEQLRKAITLLERDLGKRNGRIRLKTQRYDKGL